LKNVLIKVVKSFFCAKLVELKTMAKKRSVIVSPSNA